MTIRMNDGRVFSGTTLQIVQTMRSGAMMAAAMTLREYVEWAAGNASDMGAPLKVSALLALDDDDALARGFVDQLLNAGLAKVMP